MPRYFLKRRSDIFNGGGGGNVTTRRLFTKRKEKNINTYSGTCADV